VFGVKPTTPAVIDASVEAFVFQEFGERLAAQYVPVRLYGRAQPLDCFNNVERLIEAAGGSRRNGWAIWIHGDAMIEAEHHAVWLSPKGELIDVTPHDGEQQIVFVPDVRARYFGGNALANRRHLLRSDDQALAIMEKLQRRIDADKRFEANPPAGVVIREAPPLVRAQIPRNYFCPCDSGKRYKKCCLLLDVD
jgi:hypothetical protein